MKRILLFFYFSISLVFCYSNNINIIPKPLSVVSKEGCFELYKNDLIYYDEEFKDYAEYLKNQINESTGYELNISDRRYKSRIHLKRDNSIIEKEAYKLIVSNKEIIISASDRAGIFYGIQSLLQILPAEIYSTDVMENIIWNIPCVEVNDLPGYPWRGMMLDVARYFYDKDFVKKYIDMMAMYKLNKLQLHLIDDSGWRVEIKKYPLLTEKGAWAGTDTKRLGGYYTQEDIKEMIKYAEFRNVEIIPEIEFPAHILSAVVAYPWLSCEGKQLELPTQHFISRDLICAGKEKSYEFLFDILDETVKLFPSKYINIGGDEAVYTKWEKCVDCQNLMKKEGLKHVGELQGYMTDVVTEKMNKLGKTVIGWEEIIQRGKLKNKVVALFWHNVEDTVLAHKLGHKAILTPATHMYFDFPESDTPGEIKAAGWMPPISLEKCYSMPLNDYSDNSSVLGVQGCFWTDQFIHGTMLQELPLLDENRAEKYAEYLTFPRLLALSEVAWSTNDNKELSDFMKRISTHYIKLDYKGCHYRVPEPKIIRMEELKNGGYIFELEPTVENAEILYSTDGKYPTPFSKKYTEGVIVKNKSDFHAATFINRNRFSLPTYIKPDYSEYAEYGELVAEWSGDASKKTECTGKINKNGKYIMTFIQTEGSTAPKSGNINIFKREELIASAQAQENKNIITYEFTISEFEAGTPFFYRANLSVDIDSFGLVFIKKVN